ncbi:MAG: hypothetical protein GY786_25140 [Proteobacteria bacterium]|nr:hypothetical protein [Pseudomonadota bacterium]
MKQLKAISLSQLSTTELQFFTLQLMGLIEPLSAHNNFCARQFSELKDGTVTVESLTGLSKKNDATLTVNSADDIQDGILVGVRDTCKGKVATRHFDGEAADDAVEILDIMAEYGKPLIYGNYDEQCVAIPSFLTKMALPENVARAERTGVKLFIDALAPAHSEFVNLLNETLTNTNKPVTKLTDAKKEIRYRLDGLLGYIDLQISDEIELFGDLKVPMNLLITDVMAQMRTRITLAKKNKQK